MSKQLKNLIAAEIGHRLAGVSDALLVNVIGMNSLSTYNLRKELRGKNIQLLVVKSSLAGRATEGTPLGQAFAEGEGSLAVVWGADDFVSLAKEVVGLQKKPEFEKFQARGGLMDGEKLTAEKVGEVSKWPNRVGQIGLLMGQMLSPGGQLLSQLESVGGALASQIEQKSKDEAAPAA